MSVLDSKKVVPSISYVFLSTGKESNNQHATQLPPLNSVTLEGPLSPRAKGRAPCFQEACECFSTTPAQEDLDDYLSLGWDKVLSNPTGFLLDIYSLPQKKGEVVNAAQHNPRGGKT